MGENNAYLAVHNRYDSYFGCDSLHPLCNMKARRVERGIALNWHLPIKDQDRRFRATLTTWMELTIILRLISMGTTLAIDRTLTGFLCLLVFLCPHCPFVSASMLLADCVSRISPLVVLNS